MLHDYDFRSITTMKDIKNITKIDKNKYQVRISYIDPLTGRRRRVKRIVNGSLADALAVRDELQEAADRGDLVGKPKAKPKPLDEWVESWLDYRATRVAPSTAATERHQLKAVMEDVGDWLPQGVELTH